MSEARSPREPPPSIWVFPVPDAADEHGVVCVGADLEPGTLLAAYRSGLFPMRLGGRAGPLGWWSPDPRGILPLDGFRASRSLHSSRRRYTVRIDTAFEQVVRACADPSRRHGWIGDDFVDAYVRLHELGWAHSVEVWRDGEIAGGLYGLRIERCFAGESMFHRARDASKVALWATVDLLRLAGAELFDVQWTTPHLASLGAVDIARSEYLRRLAASIA
jgi:leucyl/phenylalanyl-tRNA--protein transferase